METRLTILLNLAFLQFSEEVGMNDCYQFGHFVRQIVTKVKFFHQPAIFKNKNEMYFPLPRLFQPTSLLGTLGYLNSRCSV